MITPFIQLWRFCAATAISVLPQERRKPLAERYKLDTAVPSFLLGIVQLFWGLGAFLFGGIEASRAVSGKLSDHLIEVDPLVAESQSFVSGLFGGLAWYFNPLAWLLAYVAIAGLARVGHYVLHREATADLLVWLGFAAWDRSVSFVLHRSELRRLGPERPDRLQPAPDGSIKLISARPKRRWEVGNSIEIDGNVYRLERISRKSYGSHQSLVYELTPQSSRKLIRRLRHYSSANAVGQLEHPSPSEP